MRTGGAVRAVAAAVSGTLLVLGATGCGGPKKKDSASARAQDDRKAPEADLKRVPGVGDRLWKRVPETSRQVLVVSGEGRNSADSHAALYTKQGSTWTRERAWATHNGRKGWTTDHHEGDLRSPVGVFTLSDAGGVLPQPEARLPYTESTAFQAPRYWKKPYWHDFDLVIAIDYNRVKGTPPNDQTRPEGQSKGGGIWLHMDHGSGTSACVSQSKADMEYLLRTLDPKRHPVVVMGDAADLKV
ncbi:L,D-transpeptidase family protein [Streptomyces griseoluteus]|uniref:L,D-transpeptidase family protein n=1 Tax=Streptomyces griseoluteus TaxID=29306 RepID=UPI0033FDB402